MFRKDIKIRQHDSTDCAAACLASVSAYYVLKYVKQVLSETAEQGKTIIMIAHRLSTVKSSDMILVLEQGQVTEAGKYEKLIAQNGAYRELWKEQYKLI